MRYLCLVFILTFILILSIPSAMAADNGTQVCSTPTVLNTTYIVYVNGTALPISIPFNCPYGCANNSCSLASILNETTLSIFMAIMFLMIIIGYRYEFFPLIFIGAVILLLIGMILLVSGMMINGVLYTRFDNIFILGIAMTFISLSIYLVATAWRT